MSNFFIGLMLLGIGAVFLLTNMGFIEADISTLIATYWPSLIILWGLYEILLGLYQLASGLKRKHYRFSRLFWGSIITIIGVIIQGNKLDLFSITLSDAWSWFWPILIIYIGFNILFKRSIVRVQVGDHEWKHWKKDSEEWKEWKKDFKNDKEAWREFKREMKNEYKHKAYYTNKGGSTKKLIGELYMGGSPWHLEDMQIWTGIGQTELDLTKAIIPEGETHLDVSGLIGEITIRVPHDMVINSHVDVKVGEATLLNHQQAGSARFLSFKDPGYDTADKKVNINISLSIGSVTVKRVD